MSSFSSTWSDEYREIVEFYWWEPQVFGRSQKNYHRFKTADEMWASVSRKEVPLNHILNVFFALFPLEKLTVFGFDESYRMVSSRTLEQIQRITKNLTQPDLFFVSKKQNIAIELKTSSKSSMAQVEKYITFNNIAYPNIPLKLIFLSPYRQLTEAIPDILGELPIEIEMIALADFHKYLKSIEGEVGSVEKKLIDGTTAYLEEYFKDFIYREG